MSFVSPEFAFAALIFFPLYWALRAQKTLQLGFLTLASYLLYSTWSAVAALALFGFSIYIWLAGNWINARPSPGIRRLSLSIGVVLALSLLLITKYYDFSRQVLIDSLPNLGLQAFLPLVDFVAPAGISFYTFQAITYLVWRYRAERQPLPLIKPLVFLSFWPTLFAGPILRADDFFRQIDHDEVGEPREAPRAVYLILLGLLQKIVLANWLADRFVDGVFRYPDAQNAASALAAIWAYSLQIFMDFSGYSLIVTGLALLLGFRLPVNFAQPYLARNLRDFWHRWHISLSTFIRDYVYFPLGGSKLGLLRTQCNLLAAMLISGLWHGASTTFVVWGLLHGLGVVAVNLFDRLTHLSLPSFFSRLLTLFYVAACWTFFRANSTDDALLLLNTLHGGAWLPEAKYGWLALFSLLFLLLSERAAFFEARGTALIERLQGWRLIAGSSVLASGIVLLGPSGVPGFIYYRF